MVCQRCRAIAIKQHKYRSNAINNDRILKEECGQPYEPPPTDREDIEKLHSELIIELFTPSTYVDARKICLHPSVTKLYKLYKNIILPNDISKSDVSPTVSLDSSEVTDWYEEQALKSSSKIDSILNQETTVIAPKETARKKTHSHNCTKKRSSPNHEDTVPNKKCKTSNESDSLGLLDPVIHLPEDIAEEYFFMDSENIMSSGMLLPAHLCTHCNKWFDTYIELMKHQKAHLICKFCKMKFQNLEFLHLHQRELCYINITKSLPTIPLIKIDSVPSIIEKYPKAFLELTTLNSENEDVDIPSALIMKDSDDIDKATKRLIKLPDLINKRFARLHVDKSFSEEETIGLLFNKYFIPKDKSIQTNFTPNNKIYCSTSNYIEVHDLKFELEKYKISIVFKCHGRISANFEEILPTSNRPVVYSWENKKVVSIRKSNKASVIIDLSNDEENEKVDSIRKSNKASVIIDLSNDKNFKTKTANNSILLRHITDNKVGGSSNKKSSHPLINRFDKNSLPRLKCTFTQASHCSNTNSSYVQPVNPTTNSVSMPPQLLYYSLPGKQQPHFIGQPHTTQNSTIQSNGAQSYNFFQVLPNSTLFSDLTQTNTIENITQPSSTSTSSQSSIQDSSANTFIQFLNHPNLLSYFPTQPATQLNQLDHNQQPINVTGNINNNILVLAPIEPTSSNQTTIEMTQLNHNQQPINVTDNINHNTFVLAPAEPTSNQTTIENNPPSQPCNTKVRIKQISELK